MNLNIYLPLFVCILGGIGYGFLDAAKYPRLVEMCRLLFWTGALAFMLTYRSAASLTIH